MLDNIKIDGFRKLKNFSLEGTNKFNIIVGPNNTGKSSLLEALSIFCKPFDFQNLLDILDTRTDGYHLQNKNYLFSEIAEFFTIRGGRFEGEEINLKLCGQWNKNLREVLLSLKFNELNKEKLKDVNEKNIGNFGVALGDFKINYSENNNNYSEIIKFTEEPNINFPNPKLETFINHFLFGTFSHRFINKDVLSQNRMLKFINIKDKSTFYDSNILNIFTNIHRLNVYEHIITTMQTINPDIDSIHVIKKQLIGVLQLLVKFKSMPDDVYPITSMGEGLRKVFFLLVALSFCKDGIFLIDELESSVHTNALEKLITSLFSLANKLNVQLFITTHSLECIDTILSNKEIDKKNLTLFKLKNKDNNISSQRISGDSLNRIRYELGQDVRW